MIHLTLASVARLIANGRCRLLHGVSYHEAGHGVWRVECKCGRRWYVID